MASPGDRLGPYEILAVIGAGGMGEVYRARDPRLGRDVAIKISAQQFTERFEREARAVAALNHPNICTLYDVGPNYLVMEYIEGEAPKGPLPLEEALRIALQIADALEAAHERGIIHRDLKPANIKVRPDGTVKVLDFGLAKVAPALAGESDGDDSATFPLTATQPGVILGTPAYMSPEQAQGQTVDKRADIWAFGVVLYETLTGNRLFKGADVGETLAAVISKEPDWTQVPAKVERLLRRCLEKDPKRRLRDIGEARWLLEEDTPVGDGRARPLPWVIAAVVTAAALALAFVHFREKPPAQAASMRFQISPPDKTNFGPQMGLSPDGRLLAFTANRADGSVLLWVRPLDSLEAKPLAGTQGYGQPFFWSPDSRFIAYGSDGKLKKVEVSGGPPQVLCDAPIGVIGGAWNRDGVIIFGQGAGVYTGGGLMRVSEAGGMATPVTIFDPSRAELNHLLPTFLPDGRHFVYLRISNRPENTGIYVGSLDVKPGEQSAKPLVATRFGAIYAPSPNPAGGSLLFLRDSTLLVQPFDPARLETVGEPVPIAGEVGTYLVHGYFSASANGILAYRRGGGSGTYSLAWFDRAGKQIGSAGEPGVLYGALALSPDGTRLAVSRTVAGNQDLWLLDLVRNTSTRFTSDGFNETAPVWSPDGSRMAFSSNLIGNLYQKLSSGAGQEEMLLPPGAIETSNDWSRDGRFLLYTETNSRGKDELWVLPMTVGAPGARKPAPFLQTEFNESQGQFSPDTHWIAYASDESGRAEIYVQPFPASSGGVGETKISEGGGTYPRWRRDGRELFYISGDQKLMAVEVTTGPVFKAGIPKPLFEARIRPDRGNYFRWDVSADGKRFLINTPAAASAEAPVTVVTNWQVALKK